jgi:hypothetical protein
MTEDEMKDLLKGWGEEFDTVEEFVSEIPPTLQGVLDVILEVAEQRGFRTPDVFRQIIMFMSFTTCNLCTDVLELSREEYLRMCEISYDAFVNMTATHETSDRRDH